MITALIDKINVFLNTKLSEQFQNLIHDIAEILLKVALNTNNQSINQPKYNRNCRNITLTQTESTTSKSVTMRFTNHL